MTALALKHPFISHTVNRTDLREQQSKFLREATGNKVVEIVGARGEEERYVVDKEYLDALVSRIRSLTETLEIMKDRKFFEQICSAVRTIEEDTRLGKLHSIEDVFGEE